MIGELDGTSFVNDKAFANGCQSSTSKRAPVSYSPHFSSALFKELQVTGK